MTTITAKLISKQVFRAALTTNRVRAEQPRVAVVIDHDCQLLPNRVAKLDNGPSYLSAELSSWLAVHSMTHTRGNPYHPMTQGKIERYHRSMKNQILLENYYLLGQLEVRLTEFVAYYNSRRYHESLRHLTPADVCCGRGQAILTRRENIKHKAIEL